MKKALREELFTALSNLLPAESGVAVIHSSFSSLLPPSPFQVHDALYAISRIVSSGWTVALPSFTFSFCSGKRFEWLRSPSETGPLSDWTLAHLHQSQRTRHPIYSFAVIGPRADEIAACTSETTFGDDSPFGLFERLNATQIMLGCGLDYCTQLHRYEELARVPYRYYKIFKGEANYGLGPEYVQAKMFVRDLDIGALNAFSRVDELMHERRTLRTDKLWRGHVTAFSTASLAATCKDMLATSPFALIANEPQVTFRLSVAREAASQPAFKVAVLGSSNLHMLRTNMDSLLAELMPERRFNLYTPAFGQLEREIIEEQSDLQQFSPGLSVFCECIEDLIGGARANSHDYEHLVRNYAELIRRHRRRHSGWIIVHTFAALTSGVDATSRESSRERVAAYNKSLTRALKGIPQLVFVDLAAEAASFAASVLDNRLWHIGRLPFSADFSRHLARRWAGLALAMLGKTTRLVIVDLDNTLWGGVLGEDGFAGLSVGGDYPGNAFQEFQRELKSLTSRGIVLAACSKNDDDLAVRALDELPSMELRSTDFSSRRINWNDKSRNIEDIAAELNLGLASVLFIDDNPVEREAVRRNLPMVKILDLPADVAHFRQTLASCPYLSAVLVTDEDKRRLESYVRRKEFDLERKRATDLDDFFAGLHMTLHFNPLDIGNANRAAQLSQKTNQFNATTRRYDLSALQELSAAGADVVVLALADRSSAPENIGLLILKSDELSGGEIDTYLLSCRVLGRGLETTIVKWALRRAAGRGWKFLRGIIIETERNTAVRGVYSDSGFSRLPNPGEWQASTETPPPLPQWLAVVDRVSANAERAVEMGAS